MLVGDPADWVVRFRSVDVRFLERVAAVWPRCRAVLPRDPDEDTITINLVDILSRDTQARRWFHHLEYQYESFGYTSSGWAYSKGKIDMALVLDFERDIYLAYECKKLRENKNGKFRSLATEYVKTGVVRFVTEQYAAGLPLGSMLGYVMDGRLDSARTTIETALLSGESKIGLLTDTVDAEPVDEIHRFVTRHSRAEGGGEIELRHALLAF